jgi:hypothetical protein
MVLQRLQLVLRVQLVRQLQTLLALPTVTLMVRVLRHHRFCYQIETLRSRQE